MRISLITMLACAGVTGGAQAAMHYVETWNGGGLEGWTVAGSSAQVQYMPAGGNPGGWVLLSNTSSDLIEFTCSEPEFIGDLADAGITSVTVDFRAIVGESTETRVKSMTVGDSGLVSGWRCQIGYATNPEWETFTLAFDPTWSDAEAEAAGWYRSGVTAENFSDTMRNVTVAGLQFFGFDETEIGVDNFGYLPCPADIDGNGDVGFTDILAVLAAWGPCPGCPEDLDGNDDVGFGDLLEVLASWGPCP